jgi:hypothetical protein
MILIELGCKLIRLMKKVAGSRLGKKQRREEWLLKALEDLEVLREHVRTVEAHF